jgi:hypothetical protein
MKRPGFALAAARVLAFGGVVWALLNSLLMAVIIDIGERDGFGCTSGQPELSLVLSAAGVVVAAAIAVGSSVAGRSRVAAGAIAVWAVLGGFAAFDCALDI